MKTIDTARLESLLVSRARQAPAPASARPAQRATLPVLYDFGGGRPDPASFPLAELARATAEMLQREGRDALTYGGPYGYDGLRDLVCEKHRLFEQAPLSRDEVLITNGSSQAIGVVADAFVEEGDTVITEAPTFGGTLGVLRRRGARVHGVPLDDEGLRTDELAALLARLAGQGVRPKLLYTITNFQNPAGPTMTLPRRQELLRLAAEHGFLVVEDDAYGELRFEGEALPTLYDLDQAGLVVRCGTLSKILGAGLRLGWAIAAPTLIPRLALCKQDWGSAPFAGRVAAYYLRDHLVEHVRELIGVYRAKRDAMLAGLASGLGERAAWSRPAGGFFIWVRLPAGTSLERLTSLAAERQVNYAPGPVFFPDGSGAEYIRLAYSYASVEEIGEGTARLCEAIRLAG